MGGVTLTACPGCGEARVMGRGYDASGLCRDCYQADHGVDVGPAYRHRDPEKRRAYMRDKMRERRRLAKEGQDANTP